MDITQPMMRAARDAEFAHYQRNHGPHDRFRPLSDGALRAIIEAAIAAIGIEEELEPPVAAEPEEEYEPPPPVLKKAMIVRARKPKPRR